MNGWDDVQELEVLLRERLQNNEQGPWKLGQSLLGGRGVIASACIAPGQKVFTDTPITIGPRVGAEGGAVCVCCLRSGVHLQPCTNGCRLPLCSAQCQDEHSLMPECTTLTKLDVIEGDSWCPEVYRALTPLRCLHLSTTDRSIIKMLQAHPPNGLASEVKLVKRSIKTELSKEDEEWLDLCCRVMDSVAFQAVTDDFETKQSPVRGLYPLAGLMNHSCTPNTRQVFDSEHRLNIISVKPIEEGEEITTSYCPLLWATPVRIAFLMKTKHFICNCNRCQDPTELGTNLAGLKCSCEGMVLPVTPQNPKSEWNCNGCEKTLSCGQALIASSILSSHPGKTKNNLSLPSTNHISVDSTLRIIFSQRNSVNGMNDVELNERENKIKNMLQLISRLNLGECRTRGLLLNELHRTMNEKVNRSLHPTIEKN